MSISSLHSHNLNEDYPKFEKALFLNVESKYKLDQQLKTQLKKYHHLVYIVALIEVKVRKKHKSNPYKFLFLGEILSDLLSISSISLIGFYRSSRILERRIIENFYNHIFFFDHLIEYDLLNSGKNDYTPIMELKKYFINYPAISSQTECLNRIKTFNDSVFNQYHELCKHVHTKGFEFMDLAKNLKQIKPNIDIVKYFKDLNLSISQIIFLLLKFHNSITFTVTEKAIINMAFPKSIRGEL